MLQIRCLSSPYFISFHHTLSYFFLFHVVFFKFVLFSLVFVLKGITPHQIQSRTETENLSLLIPQAAVLLESDVEVMVLRQHRLLLDA